MLPSKTKALFYNLVAPILGWNCVKDLRVTKIVKQIKFEGVWDKLVAKLCFQIETIIQKIIEKNSGFHVK